MQNAWGKDSKEWHSALIMVTNGRGQAPGEVWLKVLLALGVLLEYFTMSLLSCIPAVIKKLKLKQLYVHCKPPESAAITMKG